VHIDETQKAERLNRARDLLLHVDQFSDAVAQLARTALFRHVKPIATSNKRNG